MTMPIKWSSEFLVPTTNTADQSEPSIAALPDGRFVVVWMDGSRTGGDTSFTALRGQILNADGSTEPICDPPAAAPFVDVVVEPVSPGGEDPDAEQQDEIGHGRGRGRRVARAAVLADTVVHQGQSRRRVRVDAREPRRAAGGTDAGNRAGRWSGHGSVSVAGAVGELRNELEKA